MTLRSTLLLSAFALLAAATAGPGCTTACTAVGCGDHIRFVFDRSVPRDYTVTVTVAGQVGTADCTAAANPDTTATHLVQLSGGLTEYVECGADSFSYLGAPGRIAIVLEYADGSRTEAEAQPAYTEVYPNGEDCDPVCEQASADITVHAPSGS